jgi:hypothetical protein
LLAANEEAFICEPGLAGVQRVAPDIITTDRRAKATSRTSASRLRGMQGIEVGHAVVALGETLGRRALDDLLDLSHRLLLVCYPAYSQHLRIADQHRPLEIDGISQ